MERNPTKGQKYQTCPYPEILICPFKNILDLDFECVFFGIFGSSKFLHVIPGNNVQKFQRPGIAWNIVQKFRRTKNEFCQILAMQKKLFSPIKRFISKLYWDSTDSEDKFRKKSSSNFLSKNIFCVVAIRNICVNCDFEVCIANFICTHYWEIFAMPVREREKYICLICVVSWKYFRWAKLTLIPVNAANVSMIFFA